MVSTHLKKYARQIGSFPQVGLKIKKSTKPPQSLILQASFIPKNLPASCYSSILLPNASSFWGKLAVLVYILFTTLKTSFQRPVRNLRVLSINLPRTLQHQAWRQGSHICNLNFRHHIGGRTKILTSLTTVSNTNILQVNQILSLPPFRFLTKKNMPKSLTNSYQV